MKTIRPHRQQVNIEAQAQNEEQTKTEIPIKYDENCNLSFAIPIGQGDLIKVENTEYDNFTILVSEVKKENEYIVIDAEKIEGLEVEKPKTTEKTNTIEDLMTSMLPNNNTNDKTVTFEITLTKRQKELFDKKGGVQWLKKKLVGQGKRK